MLLHPCKILPLQHAVFHPMRSEILPKILAHLRFIVGPAASYIIASDFWSRLLTCTAPNAVRSKCASRPALISSKFCTLLSERLDPSRISPSSSRRNRTSCKDLACMVLKQFRQKELEISHLFDVVFEPGFCHFVTDEQRTDDWVNQQLAHC